MRSTHDLHAWLEERRLELEKEHGPQPRPDARDGSASEAQSDAEVAEAELTDRLQGRGARRCSAAWSGGTGARNAPEWWEVYRLKDLDDEALRGRPGRPRWAVRAGSYDGDIKQSKLYEYRFPVQDTKVSEVGDKPLDVDTQAEVGEILEMDAAAGCLVMKVGPQPARPDAARAGAAQATGGQGAAGVDRARR